MLPFTTDDAALQFGKQANKDLLVLGRRFAVTLSVISILGVQELRCSSARDGCLHAA